MDTDGRTYLGGLSQIQSVCISVHPWFKSLGLSSLDDSDRDEIEQQIGYRERQEFLPTKIHHLVIAEARHGPTHPHKEKNQGKNLAEEDANRKHADKDRIGGPRAHRCDPADHITQCNPWQRIPTAEEEQHENTGAHNHVRILGHEKQRPFKRTVFRVETTDEILFGFRHVKRMTIRFRKK